MLTLGFVETIETIQARNKIADALLTHASSATGDRLSLPENDVRILADDIVILGVEAGTAAANQLQPELQQEANAVGRNLGTAIAIASVGLGLAAAAVFVGVWRAR